MNIKNQPNIMNKGIQDKESSDILKLNENSCDEKELISNLDDIDNIDIDKNNDDLEFNPIDRQHSVHLEEKYNIKFEILCKIFDSCLKLKTKQKIQ